MNTWIIFLRGINVGGRNKLPMADLRDTLSEAGFVNIKTYIQSGNIILNADPSLPLEAVKERIVTAVKNAHGLDIRVLVLSPKHFMTAIAQNPFGQDFDKPNFMFLFFLEAAPSAPDLQKLMDLKTDNEKIKLQADVFYAYAGDGAGRSKMFAKIETALGVPATARNWRTVMKMAELLRSNYADT